MKRILLRLTLAFSGTALADKQCSPFDKENDGGIPQDNAACCEGAFNDDGCGPCTCENGCKDRKQRNVGDPVDALSGFAWLDDTDVNVVQPWGPPISFVRTYSTAWAQSHGGTDDIGRLGPGWSHNWADHLVLSGPPPASLVILRRGDTSTEEHRFDGTKYAARAPNKRLIWDAATSSYALELSDGGWLVFDVAGKLRTVRAPDGGESQLRYVAEDVTCAASASRPAGALCRVDFLFERSLWFDYDASGRLAQRNRQARLRRCRLPDLVHARRHQRHPARLRLRPRLPAHARRDRKAADARHGSRRKTRVVVSVLPTRPESLARHRARDSDHAVPILVRQLGGPPDSNDEDSIFDGERLADLGQRSTRIGLRARQRRQLRRQQGARDDGAAHGRLGLDLHERECGQLHPHRARFTGAQAGRVPGTQELRRAFCCRGAHREEVRLPGIDRQARLRIGAERRRDGARRVRRHHRLGLHPARRRDRPPLWIRGLLDFVCVQRGATQ